MPTLIWQIENNRPVTVTHPEVSRFFMTIPEAAALVIEASSMAVGGETYILDMGQQVKIMDLINRYVKIMGCNYPEIIYTGLRSGEKLQEELIDPSEIHMPTEHPRITKANVDQSGKITAWDKMLIRDLVETALSPKEFKNKLREIIYGIENRKVESKGQNRTEANYGLPESI